MLNRFYIELERIDDICVANLFLIFCSLSAAIYFITIVGRGDMKCFPTFGANRKEREELRGLKR